MPSRAAVVDAPETPVASDQFVVTVGAVNLATGQNKPNGKPEVVRILKGGLINAPATHPSIKQLLATKTIAAYVPGEPVKTPTPKMVCRAMGGLADPVEAPRADVQPVAPSAS